MEIIRGTLPKVSLLLCAGCLVLLLVDLIWPGIMLFLKEWVKVYLLAACLVTAAAGVLLASRQRAATRASRRRRS